MYVASLFEIFFFSAPALSAAVLTALMLGIGGISWAGKKRWNVVKGCDRESPGCKNCWIFPLIKKRLSSMNSRYEEDGTEITLHTDIIKKPLSWNKPRLIFVNSMGDLFHDVVPEWVIRDMFEVMNEADHHVYQILTKRPERLARIGPSLSWHDHIWMGVSVENDDSYRADGYAPTDRIEDLRQSTARVMWISAEPLIGPLPDLDLRGIDWLVVGGESVSSGDDGEARPLKVDWIRSIIRQCREAGVAVHVKQLGTKWADENGYSGKADDPDQWPSDLQVREQPKIFPDQPQPVAEIITPESVNTS